MYSKYQSTVGAHDGGGGELKKKQGQLGIIPAWCYILLISERIWDPEINITKIIFVSQHNNISAQSG